MLTSAVLQASCRQRRESLGEFAARAGIAPDTVADGTQPAWAVPCPEFDVLADAVAVGDPSLRQLFETAVACDLLLTCVLAGDQAFATDVLADETTRDEARWLLRLAMTGRRPARLADASQLVLPQDLRVLGKTDAVALRHRTAALAVSGAPDAWVGSELASLVRSAA